MVTNGIWLDREQLNMSDWYDYSNMVRKLTDATYRKHKQQINPNNLPRRRGYYHVDHIFSIYDGFIHEVPIEVMAAPVNLQMLTETSNSSKNNKSWCTVNELYQRYNEWSGVGGSNSVPVQEVA